MDRLERKRKKAGRKSIWQRLTHRFRLELVDEDSLGDVFSRRISLLDVLLLTVVVFAAVSVGAVYMYKKSPDQKREIEMRQRMADDLARLDSIEERLLLNDIYIRAVQDVLLGNIKIDSLFSLDSIVSAENHRKTEASETEIRFVEEYEEREKYNVTNQEPVLSDVQSRNIFRPTVGIVAREFDVHTGHYGVDIAAHPDESVVTVMDGTVLISNYTAEDGYVICIYHTDDLFTVYRQCSALLKKPGDKVTAGEVIALVGGPGPDGGISHLHFEIWYEGKPLDPQKYIVFR